jgi:hypothetical protein
MELFQIYFPQDEAIISTPLGASKCPQDTRKDRRVDRLNETSDVLVAIALSRFIRSSLVSKLLVEILNLVGILIFPLHLVELVHIPSIDLLSENFPPIDSACDRTF